MKWYFKILIAVLLLLAIAFFSIDQIATNIAVKNIKIIQEELRGKYNFDYEKLDVSITSKEIVLKNFSLVTIVDSSTNNENKFDFKLDKLVLHFDRYRDVLSNGRLHILYIELKKPEISYGVRRKMSKDDVDDSSFIAQSASNALQFSDTNSGLLVNSLLIDKLIIIDGETEIYHLDDPSKKLIHIERLNLHSKDLEVNFIATKLDDIVSSTEMIINLKKITSDELTDHDLVVSDLNFTITKNELVISNIHFKNSEEPAVFASHKKYRTPWLDIKVDTVKMIFNPWHVYNKGVFYVERIEINGADVTLYNDLTLALKQIHQPMPPRAIRDITIPIKVDSIRVMNSHLKYLHKIKAELPGIFELDNIDLRGSNFTNIDYLIDQDSVLILNIKAVLWDSGKLKANVSIDLKNQLDYVNIKGSVVNMPLSKAENMVKPMFGVTIPSGYLNNLSYNLTMNENIGIGALRFDYTDLKVDIKKDSTSKHTDESGNVKSNKFFSFIGNEAVLSNNIPGSKNYIDEGYMIFDRTKNKPIFDLYWHSLQTGIMDVAIVDAFYNSKYNYEKKEKKKTKDEHKKDKHDSSKKKKKDKRSHKKKKN